MRSPRKSSYVTVEEYLKAEECASVKHEYVDGQVYAMTGVVRRHRAITRNIFRELDSFIKGSGCEVAVGDAQVHIEETNSFYYPDIVVSCGAIDDDAIVVSDAVLVVEVLSRSTASIDKREKVFAYRKVPTIVEYLIVHQKTKHLELRRKNSDGQWDVFDIIHDGVELESMPCGKIFLSLDLIYEGVACGESSGGMVREDSSNYSTDDADEVW
jgi:Uma2 family endonuclease